MIRVKAAFFSLTPPAPPDDDGSYLRWHLLDHMPEQYQIPGIQFALRYIADGDYRASRIAGNGPLADVGNVVNYLVGDPVERTHWDFMELGPRLAEMGRFPEFRSYLQLRMPALLHWYAAPQAQVWIYGDTQTWNQHPNTRGDLQHTTVIYLDGDDPLATTNELRSLIEARWESGAVRPLFAGPLRNMIQWDAWPPSG